MFMLLPERGILLVKPLVCEVFSLMNFDRHLDPGRVIVLVFLIYASVVDVRRREIDPVVTVLTALAGVVYVSLVRAPEQLALGGGGWGVAADVVLSLLPGLCLTAFGFLSRGAVGIGDGLTLLVTGFFLPVMAVDTLCAAACLLSAVFSAGVLIFKRGSRRTSFPFAPFLLAGAVVSVLAGV